MREELEELEAMYAERKILRKKIEDLENQVEILLTHIAAIHGLAERKQDYAYILAECQAAEVIAEEEIDV